MSSIVGARKIAAALSQVTGLEISQWQIYRLAKRKHSPIRRDPEGVMLSTTRAELLQWWRDSPFAPIFAKQLERRRGSGQAAGEGMLRIFGVIGLDDLTDERFLSSIDQLEDPKTIRVLINSEGGAVSHGLAMYHALRSHKAKVHVEIVGVAASMASAIAMAGDTVSMAEDGLFMIHDPWVAAAGNAEDLRAAADMLEKHGESLAAIYARKTGIDEAKIRDMMRKDGGEGTWLNAREAQELGFVDEVLVPANARLPDLPAAALAKRITAGRRKKGTRLDQPRRGAGNMKFAKLAAVLKAAIAALVTDETPEDEVIEQVAEATDVETSVVTELLAGEGDAPTIEGLQAYAEVLDLELETLVTAAKKDGVKVEMPTKPPKAKSGSRQAIPAARQTDVAAAVREELARQRKMRAQALAVGERLGIPATDLAQIVNAAEDIESANQAMIDWLAKPENQKKVTGMNSSVTLGADDRDKWFEGMSQWLIVKSGNARMVEAHLKQLEGKPVRLDPGNFRGYALIDICRDVLEREGVNVRGMSPYNIAKAVLSPRAGQAGLGTRSDFPVLLENVLHKMLLAAYETATDQWRSFCGIGSVSDFRLHPRLRLGQLARLDRLLESGEFKQLHFPDAEKESIKAETFGNVIGLSRQSIVNDDVDGFSRLTVMLGRAGARSIEIDVFALLQLNSGLGPALSDGNTLFHANHSNIDGSAGAPAVATLEAGRVLMAQQKDPADQDFLNLRPDIWVGPIGHGAAARTAISAEFDFDAETSGNTGKFMKPNVVRDLLSTVVDTPRLTGNRWYLFADPAIAPVIEVVFLEGQESPVIEAEQGFDYDGVRWNIKHDYGVGATDHRGATTNAGS